MLTASSTSARVLDAKDRRPRFFVLTGFLGSGKTTLLSRWLTSPAGANTAVLINELGEVALDHLLVERVDQDVSLLPAGCVCCVVSGELDGAIERVLSLTPARIVLETTGIADPAPVLHALATSQLADRFDSGASSPRSMPRAAPR